MEFWKKAGPMTRMPEARESIEATLAKKNQREKPAKTITGTRTKIIAATGILFAIALEAVPYIWEYSERADACEAQIKHGNQLLEVDPKKEPSVDECFLLRQIQDAEGKLFDFCYGMFVDDSSHARASEQLGRLVRKEGDLCQFAERKIR